MTEIAAIVASAKKAQQAFEAKAVCDGNQRCFDLASKAVAWALMHPKRNAELSQLAVETTGLGKVADKIEKTIARH